VGEASASEQNPEPTKDFKGDAWVGLLGAGFPGLIIIAQAKDGLGDTLSS
jgi:hypothetical protein